MSGEAPARILVVEDDPAILTALTEKLGLEGYDVTSAADGEEARVRLADDAPDLVVLDLMLPRLDGVGVLRWLRERWAELPVLILSARSEERDKVEGLRRGADDYLTKPFGIAELLARIQALLRRSRGPRDVLTLGDLEVDLAAGVVTSASGERIELSRKEHDLLSYLQRHRGRPVSRGDILAAVWGGLTESSDRQVDWHIARLRKKLEPRPGSPRWIVTRHGRGYELRGS